MDSLPLGLRQVLESGDCVLFIGAGIGFHLHKPDGSTLPDGKKLAANLCTNFGITPQSDDLAKVAQLVEIRKTREHLENFVKKALADATPDDAFRWLTTFRWRAIFTTNYDRGIERAYELGDNVPQIPVSMSLTSELQYTDPRTQVPIFHLHGALFGDHPSHIVITRTDYARFQEKRQMLWSRLKSEFATSTFLYIGYSGNDPNWDMLLDELTSEYYPSELPRSYRIDPYANEMDVEILRAKNIETLRITLEEFQAAVQAELGDFRPDPDFLRRFEDRIPTDLNAAFRTNPALVLRLLNSWEYINAADFNEAPNKKQFLLGDKPNWSLIAADVPFRRELEDEVWDDVLEFATSPTAKSRALAIIAPAGYGITTFLMTIGAKIVKAKIGPVFKLREQANVLEGDVAFAATLFPEVASFFVIDDCREHTSALSTAIAQQRMTTSNCLFVVGERKNEWRMARPRLKADEYEIQPLSDGEIDALLDYLTRENALNKLGELDRPFQFSIVKEKHEKQLLVAMREATEGLGFDVIIENEFRGIYDKEAPEQSSVARDAYLLTSCFYQQGVFIRDQLLAEILGKGINELYELIGDALEGLVIFEETDLARGEYAARTRHRVIAEVVWKKGAPGTREQMLQAAMEKLNLSYRLDKLVFERFVRHDDIVDSFRTLEGKTKFFETACKRDPQNPYVLQHFARMLLREEHATMALGQIDAALEIAKDVRVLHHTKATILADLAVAADNEEIGRKWLIQSENEFRRCITMAPRDDYSYQGLALLFLNWARRAQTGEESSEYITRCEEIVSEGLRAVRDREALWIVSADVQKWLGNQPGQIKNLQKAVNEGTTAIIPRYLLGRAYRQQGLPEKCIEVLDPVVRSQFSEFRSFVEYVRAMLDLGEPYSKCIAVLSQAKLDGLTDPAYVGLLGGLLFMQGETQEAISVFRESVDRSFTFEENKTVQFTPRDPSDLSQKLRLNGRVVGVKPGYLFIQNERFPRFWSHTTRVLDTILQRGMQVSFEPAFTAKGAIAQNLQLVAASGILSLKSSV